MQTGEPLRCSCLSSHSRISHSITQPPSEKLSYFKSSIETLQITPISRLHHFLAPSMVLRYIQRRKPEATFCPYTRNQYVPKTQSRTIIARTHKQTQTQPMQAWVYKDEPPHRPPSTIDKTDCNQAPMAVVKQIRKADKPPLLSTLACRSGRMKSKEGRYVNALNDESEELLVAASS